MTRLICGGLAVAVSLVSATALAETQAEIAARDNEEGKTLMFAGKYAEASQKFQDASARVGEPKYYFNLCTSRFQEGRFGDALTACNAADKNADEKLKAKIAKMAEKIREEAGKQGIDLQPAGGGGGPGTLPPVDPTNPTQPPPGDPTDPNQVQVTPTPTGDPNAVGAPPPGYGVGRPPEIGLFQQVRPENKYTWSLGVDLFFGGGNVGERDRFGNSAGGIRFKSDYLLNPRTRFGAQGYFQYSSFTQGETMTTAGLEALDIMDIGVAGYKHFCGPHARGCLTPLVGVHLAMFSPNNDNDGRGTQLFNYGGLGVRAEIGYHYALGRRYEHVLGVMAGFNGYTKPFAEPAGDPADLRGLDRGGVAGYFSFGYTYRFQTPLGRTPFLTLE